MCAYVCVRVSVCVCLHMPIHDNFDIHIKLVSTHCFRRTYDSSFVDRTITYGATYASNARTFSRLSDSNSNSR